MKRSFRNLVLGCACAAIAASSGCTPSNKVPAGAPLLVSFDVVVDPGKPPLDLTTDAGTKVAIPGLSIFYAEFDRLLDPTSLETIDPDGGAITANQGVATIDWTGGSIALSTLYIPNGDHQFTLIPAAFTLFGVPILFANGPSITISPDMGLPSGSRVTVALDPAKVRSHDQTTSFKADDGVTSPLVVDVEPLWRPWSCLLPCRSDAGSGDDAATDDGGAGDGGTGANVAPPVGCPDYVAHVTFNNLTADATMDQIQVTGMAGTTPIVDLGAVVARDDMAPAGWTVSPPPDGWPPGAVVTITVTAEAVDNFGIKLGTPVSGSFTVKVGP